MIRRGKHAPFAKISNPIPHIKPELANWARGSSLAEPNRQSLLRFLIDHDFNERILRDLRSCIEIDAMPARAVGLDDKPDPELLSWAAAEDRILVSHDLQTMPRFAIARVRSGKSMPGLILVPQELGIGKAIEELTMIALCSGQTEWREMIIYIPL